jgi:hypothetical protein
MGNWDNYELESSECNKRIENLQHKVGLELIKVDAPGSVNLEQGRNAGHNLGDQMVGVSEAWRGDAEVPLADLVDSLAVNLQDTLVSANYTGCEYDGP